MLNGCIYSSVRNACAGISLNREDNLGKEIRLSEKCTHTVVN